MHFNISSPGPLIGRTGIPGDRRLTLTTLAFSMLLSETVTIENPSTSPDVVNFEKFLEQNGASIDYSRNTVRVKGKPWGGTVQITPEVPDTIIHCIISTTLFSARTIKIVEGVGRRSRVVSPILNVLKEAGLSGENISEEDNDVIVRGAIFSPPDIVHVNSAWAFEAVILAAFSVHMPVVISYPAQSVTHSLQLVTLLGSTVTRPDGDDGQNIELSLRLARAGGGISPDIRKFEWTGGGDYHVKIPGDSTLAAAVCGAAALVQRSDVTVEGVVWEQGRRGFFDALRRMKIPVEWKSVKDRYSFEAADVRVRWSKSEGIHLSSGQGLTMSSELLILGSVAAAAAGETVVSDTNESPGFGRDAFTSLAGGLALMGAHVGDFSEGIVLHGGSELRGSNIDTDGDSDVALALTVAALNASGTTIISGFQEEDYPAGEFLRIVSSLASAERIPGT